MSGGYFSEAIVFLVRTLFDLYIAAVVLRFLLQWVKADFYNPISQFLVTVTNPPLRPLRRFIPGYAGVDWATVVLMLLLKVIEISILALIVAGRIPALPGLLVISFAEIMSLIIYIFIIAVFIQVVLSWVNPHAYNPATVLLYKLTEPLMRPARRLIPSISGLDLSPIVVFIVLQLTLILLVKPITHLGFSLGGFVI